MNFIQAVRAAKNGAVIKTPKTTTFKSNGIELENFCPVLRDILATDWEIVEEKKPISRSDLEKAWNSYTGLNYLGRKNCYTHYIDAPLLEHLCKELGL